MTKLLGLRTDATYVAIYDTEATGVEEKDRMIQGAFGLYELNTEKKSMKLIKYHEEMINPGDVKNKSICSCCAWILERRC